MSESLGQQRVERCALPLYLYSGEPIQSLQIRSENFYLRLEVLDRTDVPPLYLDSTVSTAAYAMVIVFRSAGNT
jgi:hypothetical protein